MQNTSISISFRSLDALTRAQRFVIGALVTLFVSACGGGGGRSVRAGGGTVTYAIEADTATTAILNVIVKTYDTSNALQVTQQSRYRVAADGSLTVLTIDVQYSGPSTAHLLYTKT